jgi:hypothetical protein
MLLAESVRRGSSRVDTPSEPLARHPWSGYPSSCFCPRQSGQTNRPCSRLLRIRVTQFGCRLIAAATARDSTSAIHLSQLLRVDEQRRDVFESLRRRIELDSASLSLRRAGFRWNWVGRFHDRVVARVKRCDRPVFVLRLARQLTDF